MNFLDILITSPQDFYKKSMGTRKEKLFFDIRGLRVNFYNIPSLANRAALDTSTSLDVSLSSLILVPSKKFRKTVRISEHFEYNGPEKSKTKMTLVRKL